METRYWKAPSGYLNTASFGIPSERSQSAIRQTLKTWETGELAFGGWLTQALETRASIAQITNAPSSWVALGSSTAPMLGSIAAALPDGAQILAPTNEHNYNLIPYLNQAHRGIWIKSVPLHEIVDHISHDTALVSCSAVQSLTGAVADIKGIREATRRTGTLFALDLSQACGWLPVKSLDADILVCSVYKWLCSPIGGAFLVMNPELSRKLRPVTPGWVTGREVMAAPYGTDFQGVEETRRFDTVPNLISMISLKAAIEDLLSVGLDDIQVHNVCLANRFRELMDLEPSNSAIVTMRWPGANEHLLRRGVRATEWQGNLRLAFHIYNSESDADEAASVLRTLRG